MILLIPSGTKKQVVIPTLFKFHYDSINSGASGEVWSSWWKFKFHYDSINSKLPIRKVAQGHSHLNSIMILLIPVPKSSPYLSQKTSLFCRPLQNSTFLSCP